MSPTGCSSSTARAGSRSPGAAADRPDEAAAAIDLRPFVLMPGMVDLHAHLPQVPNAGIGYALDLLTWLDRVTFPTEQSWSDPAVAESLVAGHLRGVRQGGDDDRAGLRRRLRGRDGRRIPGGRGERDPGHPRQGDDGSRDVRPGHRAVHDPRPLVARIGRPHRPLARRRRAAGSATPSPPASPSRARPTMLRESAALAASTGTWWQTHVSEDPFEIAEVARLHPEAEDYVDVYERAGGLGARTVLAHAIHLSDRELGRLVTTGTHVAHCPASNLFIGAGVMPLARYREAGLSMGLGSDVSGGPEMSIFSVMRVGAYAQMARQSMGGDGAVLDPFDWLRLGTLDGARALGLGDVIGSLEAGKEADVIAIDPSFVAPLAGQPPDDDPAALASRLIFRAHPDMVRAAWVRGRRLEGPGRPG